MANNHKKIKELPKKSAVELANEDQKWVKMEYISAIGKWREQLKNEYSIYRIDFHHVCTSECKDGGYIIQVSDYLDMWGCTRSGRYHFCVKGFNCPAQTKSSGPRVSITESAEHHFDSKNNVASPSFKRRKLGSLKNQSISRSLPNLLPAGLSASSNSIIVSKGLRQSRSADADSDTAPVPSSSSSSSPSYHSVPDSPDSACSSVSWSSLGEITNPLKQLDLSEPSSGTSTPTSRRKRKLESELSSIQEDRFVGSFIGDMSICIMSGVHVHTEMAPPWQFDPKYLSHVKDMVSMGKTSALRKEIYGNPAETFENEMDIDENGEEKHTDTDDLVSSTLSMTVKSLDRRQASQEMNRIKSDNHNSDEDCCFKYKTPVINVYHEIDNREKLHVYNIIEMNVVVDEKTENISVSEDYFWNRFTPKSAIDRARKMKRLIEETNERNKRRMESIHAENNHFEESSHLRQEPERDTLLEAIACDNIPDSHQESANYLKHIKTAFVVSDSIIEHNRECLKNDIGASPLRDVESVVRNHLNAIKRCVLTRLGKRATAEDVKNLNYVTSDTMVQFCVKLFFLVLPHFYLSVDRKVVYNSAVRNCVDGIIRMLSEGLELDYMHERVRVFPKSERVAEIYRILMSMEHTHFKSFVSSSSAMITKGAIKKGKEHEVLERPSSKKKQTQQGYVFERSCTAGKSFIREALTTMNVDPNVLRDTLCK